MNQHVNPADTAMALYATACETHQRRDWREACHALARALKASASRQAMQSASEPAPVPYTVAAVKTKAPKPAKVRQAATYTMEAGSLAAAIKLVCGTMERKNTIPVLLMARLTAGGDSLTITSTDLDIETTVIVQAPGIGTWEVLAPAFELAAIVAKVDKAAPVTLKGDQGKPFQRMVDSAKTVTARNSILQVTTHGASWSLNGLPVADFPTMTYENAEPVEIDPMALRGALAFVRPCISDEETRYYLTGAFLAGNGDVVATDGRRLAVSNIGAPMPAIIVPAKTVRLLLDVLAPGASLTSNRHKVRVCAGAVTITSKTIDGSYPEYPRVIPASANATVMVDRKAFAAAVQAVASICTDKSRSITLTFEGVEATLTARNMDGGKAERRVPFAWNGGARPFDIGFNADYARQAMASLDGETVSLAFTVKDAPGVVRSLDPCLLTGADASRRIVLMPLRA